MKANSMLPNVYEVNNLYVACLFLRFALVDACVHVCVASC